MGPRLCIGRDIALVEAGRPIAGVVYAPARDEMYDAAVGEGAEAVALYELLRVLPDVGHDEVDVEELAVPQRLADALGEVQPGHLLVADLGVHAHQVRVLERNKPGDTFGWGVVFSDATLDNMRRCDAETAAAIEACPHITPPTCTSAGVTGICTCRASSCWCVPIQ